MTEDCLLAMSLTLAKALAEGHTKHEIGIIIGFLSNTISNLNTIACSRNYDIYRKLHSRAGLAADEAETEAAEDIAENE